MALSIDDLDIIQKELFSIRARAYDIGLMLKVPVETLDIIRSQYDDPGYKLFLTLNTWLEMAVEQKWQTIVEALRTNTVGEAKLASDIEAKYCQDIKQKLPEQQHTSEATQEATVMKLTWRNGPRALERMYRGSVATDGTMVYCNGGGPTTSSLRVHQYNSDTHQWSTLPNLPHHGSTLVMVDNMLTSVGGYRRRFLLFVRAINSLFSLMGEGRDRKWSQHFPPMCTERRGTAAICHGRFLIVAGGHDFDDELDRVEVMNIDTRNWYIACSLPHPLSWATTSICGEKLYLLGGRTDDIEGRRSVFTCSISKLLHSQSQHTIWQRIADAPCEGSSCATLCGQLVAVGGVNEANKATATILIYNENTDSWKSMEPMTTSRSVVLATSLHDDMLMVIGGIGRRPLATVEIADVS